MADVFISYSHVDNESASVDDTKGWIDRFELAFRRRDARCPGEDGAVPPLVDAGRVIDRDDLNCGNGCVGGASPDALPARSARHGGRVAVVHMRRQFQKDAAFLTREEGADGEFDAVPVRSRVGPRGPYEADSVGQRQVHARIFDRRSSGLLQFALKEGSKGGSVVHEPEVAVASSRDSAHVRLIEIEPDAHRRDRDASLEARRSEALGLGARIIESVADEHDTPHAMTVVDGNRVQTGRKAPRDRGAAACLQLVDASNESFSYGADTSERLDELRVVRVTDEGYFVVVFHVAEEARDRAPRMRDLFTGHGSRRIERDDHGQGSM